MHHWIISGLNMEDTKPFINCWMLNNNCVISTGDGDILFSPWKLFSVFKPFTKCCLLIVINIFSFTSLWSPTCHQTPISMCVCKQLDLNNTEATSTAACTCSAMFAVLYRQQCKTLQIPSLNNSDWTIITQHFSCNIYYLVLLLAICCFTEEQRVCSVECSW